MSWAGLASNQTISFTNLKDGVDTGVFIQKIAQVVSNEQITKTDANNYVYLNTSASPYSTKASNQLVVKSDLVPRCWCWIVTNDDSVTRNVTFTPCGTDTPVTIPINCCGDFFRLCSNKIPTIDTFFASVVPCGTDGNILICTSEDDCIGCADCGTPCNGQPGS
jgi:hypothetical protein